MVVPERIKKAALCGRVGVIEEWFASAVRDPNERDATGVTLLRHAAQNGHCATMRALLRRGASLDATYASNDWTPLHVAVNRGRDAAAVLLLDHGASLDRRTIYGSTPLILAAIGGHYAMVQFLLNRGADLGARQDGGRDAESQARARGEPKTAELLAAVRREGGWRSYAAAPRRRLLALRVLGEQGRARTDDPLLRRLFPAAPPAAAAAGAERRPRASYRAAEGGRLPRGIFAHIIAYWRCARDFPEPYYVRRVTRREEGCARLPGRRRGPDDGDGPASLRFRVPPRLALPGGFGVHRAPATRFAASIEVDGEREVLGRFRTASAAARAYDARAREVGAARVGHSAALEPAAPGSPSPSADSNSHSDSWADDDDFALA